MAIYGNNNNTTTKTAPRTDYETLVHNGVTYKTLDEMIDRIARERAKVAFKSTKLILEKLGSKDKDETIVAAMVSANAEMIRNYLDNRDTTDSLFGL